MLDLPTPLTDWERDKLKLDFALWLAKRARRFHCEREQIIEVVIGVSLPRVEVVSPETATQTSEVIHADGEPSGTRVDDLIAPPADGDTADAEAPSSVGVLGGADAVDEPVPAIAADAASATDATGTVRPTVVSSRADKSGEDRSSPAPTLTARVQAIYDEHPDWTGTQVHAALPGTKFNSVNATLTQVRKKARPSPVEAPEPAPEPEVPAAVERQPTITPEPPAINIKDRMRALNKSEPNLDAYAAAERLGVSPGSVRSFSAEMGLLWSVPGSPQIRGPQPQLLTLRDKVLAVHRHHPTWTSGMIAKHLGGSVTSVSTYLAEARRVVEKEAGRVPA